MGDERPGIVLYSASPRRKELLERAGLPFTVRPVDADESIPSGLDAPEVVTTIALRKLQAGLALPMPRSSLQKRSWGLAADTLVEGPNGLLGKPADAVMAVEMIQTLSGVSHQVHSGFAISAPDKSGSVQIRTGVHSTVVVFRELSEKEIQNYVATGEWQGAAGAYRIQELGEILVDRIDGLWSTIVGLPLGPLYGILSELSYPLG